MRQYNDAYKAGYSSVISELRQKLGDIRDYDVRQKYEAALSKVADSIAVSCFN